jgi:hypothetical protein
MPGSPLQRLPFWLVDPAHACGWRSRFPLAAIQVRPVSVSGASYGRGPNQVWALPIMCALRK